MALNVGDRDESRLGDDTLGLDPTLREDKNPFAIEEPTNASKLDSEEPVFVSHKPDPKRVMKIAAAVTLVMCLMYFGINTIIFDLDNNSDNIDLHPKLGDEERSRTQESKKEKHLSRGAEQLQESLAKEKEGYPSPQLSDLRNPYWALPNNLAIERENQKEMLSVQEHKWRIGLSHRYPARAYMAVQDMRQQKRSGSEYLYFEALNHRKFWTRMEALRGLVELGLDVDLETVEKSIGKVRRSLIRNYIKRLARNPSQADQYVMRQLVRIVDAPTRLVILKSLSSVRDSTNELYLVAAVRDPSVQIQTWLRGLIQINPLSSGAQLAYRNLLDRYRKGVLSSQAPEEVLIEELEVEELADDDLAKEVTFFQDILDQEDDKAEPGENGN